MGMPDSWATYLMGKENTGWRLLMMLAALPALVDLFIRIFVPESKRHGKRSAIKEPRRTGPTAISWVSL